MKARLFVIFIMFHFVSYGQTNHSLVDTNKLWSNLFHNHTGGPPPYVYQTNFIKFFGDTIIDFNTYKKVHKTYDSTQSSWFVIGYIREDTFNRVYYYRQQDSCERLLYDFNVNAGDTLNISNFGVYNELIVSSVDSVYVYDKYVKRINIDPWEVWYEGIGSLFGILHSGMGGVVGSVNALLCYYENDTLKYHNSMYNECYLNFTVEVEDKYVNSLKVTIFPHPIVSSSNLKVENMQGKILKLEIYSLLGQRLISTEICEETTISKSDFESGIYIYRIVASSFVRSGKFVIK